MMNKKSLITLWARFPLDLILFIAKRFNGRIIEKISYKTAYIVNCIIFIFLDLNIAPTMDKEADRSIQIAPSMDKEVDRSLQISEFN